MSVEILEPVRIHETVVLRIVVSRYARGYGLMLVPFLRIRNISRGGRPAWRLNLRPAETYCRSSGHPLRMSEGGTRGK
jgi:hypothetical protein